MRIVAVIRGGKAHVLRSFGGAWAQWISASERVRMSAEMPGEEVADMTIELPDEPWELPLPGDVLTVRGDGANRVAVANRRKPDLAPWVAPVTQRNLTMGLDITAYAKATLARAMSVIEYNNDDDARALVTAGGHCHCSAQFREYYGDWQKAFALASDGGVVKFH